MVFCLWFYPIFPVKTGKLRSTAVTQWLSSLQVSIPRLHKHDEVCYPLSWQFNTSVMPYKFSCERAPLRHKAWRLFDTNVPNLCTIRHVIMDFYIHGSVHLDSISIRSNETQQYPGVYLLPNYSTCFGCLSHPSSGVHQTVTAASGTGHTCSVRATTFRQLGLIRPRWRKVVALTRDMTCTSSCSYSLMYSWRWVRWTPETCRVILQ